MAKKIKKKAIKKLSAYQKLKAKNLALHQDIYTLIRGDYSDKLRVETIYESKFRLEDLVWGTKPENTHQFDGLVTIMTNGKKD